MVYRVYQMVALSESRLNIMKEERQLAENTSAFRKMLIEGSRTVLMLMSVVKSDQDNEI
jgi:hypothetical protein